MAKLLIIFVVPLAIAAVSWTVGWVKTTRLTRTPNNELAGAMRLLDKIIAYDTAVPALSIPLRDEAVKITTNYYKGITK